jgi:hypothetical protein
MVKNEKFPEVDSEKFKRWKTHVIKGGLGENEEKERK